MTTDARALDWDELTARLAAAAESPAGAGDLPGAAVRGGRRGGAASHGRGRGAGAALARGRDAAVAGGAGDRARRWRRRRSRWRSAPKSCARSRRSRGPRRRCGAICSRPRRSRSPRSRRWRAISIRPLGLARAIDETFDAAGEIRDTASPELERLRGRAPGAAGPRARRHRGADARRRIRVGDAGPVLHHPRRALRVAAEGQREVARAGHRARHVAHGRDRVRRADRAGRGEQPAQGHRAGDPARVAADPRAADRRRRDRGGTAAADGGDAGGDRRARGGGAAGGRLRRQPRRDRRRRRSSSCATRATRCSRCRTRPPAWSPTTSRWAAGSRRS